MGRHNRPSGLCPPPRGDIDMGSMLEGKDMNEQFRSRISERVSCSIAVAAGDTLNRHPATIVDLSRHGAQVRCDAPFDAGKTIHLDLDGEFTWATVAWSEIDRMGLRFVSPLGRDTLLGRRLAGLQTVRHAPQALVRQSGFGRRRAA